MENKISILGCGWLGLPLARALVARNYRVAGSTTTPAKLPVLAQLGIQPFLLDLTAPENNPENKALFQSPILIVNVPPKRSSGNPYAQQMKTLRETLRASKVKKMIFVSSTSVYAAGPDLITEESALDEENAGELVTAEKIMADPENPWQTTIIRFSGLFGPGRAPGRFLAGKTNLPDPEAPVNLIHLDDCVEIMLEVLKQEKWGEIYNACADEHPTRQNFYTAAARKLALPEPTFAPENGIKNPGKTISNQKLKTDLAFAFRYPDPLSAL